jgi:hypothetical protein
VTGAWKPGDAHHHRCTCRDAYSRVIPAQSAPARAPVISRTGGAALQLSGTTEGKGGGIEGADARQSASRSTAPRRTHAQTTSSFTNTSEPAGEASRHHSASVYRSNRHLKAVARSAVVGDAIAIGGLAKAWCCGRRGVGWLDLSAVRMPHYCWTETGSQMSATVLGFL